VVDSGTAEHQVFDGIDTDGPKLQCILNRHGDLLLAESLHQSQDLDILLATPLIHAGFKQSSEMVKFLR